MITVRREKSNFLSCALVTDKVGYFHPFLKYYFIPEATVELRQSTVYESTHFLYLPKSAENQKPAMLTLSSKNPSISKTVIDNMGLFLRYVHIFQIGNS